MAVMAVQISIWDSILEITKAAQEKGSDPLLWAIQLSSNLNSAGVSLPSPELANLLVSHICWANNQPIAWKFLERALAFKIVPPLLVLALLSNRFLCFWSLWFLVLCVFRFSFPGSACVSVYWVLLLI
ncbi:Mediator of RNA polymerase II transcription subunit 33A [Sarracenia purpurea var. burkii]